MLTITKKITSSDHQLAKVLQEQFQNEYEAEKSGDRLAYKKPNKHNLNSSKCLVDPSWEVIDPTPDIHILFMAFNERFFWNKLLAVCVSWSKRMTTCAGICSYQGRGGMCSITLSEPLLKLRPRRDLVETLLHEMIHAYLFVTHNNRDRDGHGPEFHKHMYRINAESGTNITVYHDFHDEVRLYKQHWWKCDGPCQSWKPYYGMVKRAMNRAPGPTDRWWGEHSRSCGGNFIKIKEPEKAVKATKSGNTSKKKPETVTSPLPDIRKHFVPNEINSKNKTTVSSSSITSSASKKTSVTTINDLTSTTLKHNAVTSNRNNTTKTTSAKTSITTINDLTTTNSVKLPSKTDTMRFPNTPGRTLSNSSIPNKDYSLVRNHWLNKFSDSKTNETKQPITNIKNNQNSSTSNITFSKAPPGSSNDLYVGSKGLHGSLNTTNYTVNKTNSHSSGLKRSSSESISEIPEKIPKLFVDVTDNSPSPSLVECPVCSKKYSDDKLNDHLDQCLNTTQPCIVCDKNVPELEYQEHVNECCNTNFDDNDFVNTNQEKDDLIVISSEKTESANHVAPSSVKFEQCAVCDKPIEASLHTTHLSECIQKMYENFEDKYIKNPSTKCPVCEKEIPENDLTEHLENCRDLSDIFEDDGNVPSEKEENKENNCPICSKLVDIKEMNSHIDICLNIAVDA